MASEIIQITLTEKESEKLMLLEEAGGNFRVRTTGPSNATSTKPLIQRATHILRSLYEEEKRDRHFKPISVSIGPLHREKELKQGSRFEKAETFKRQLAAAFIDHSGSTKEDVYKNVKKEIKSLRECYDPIEVVDWEDEELAWMFLVDGCALLYFIFPNVRSGWGALGGKNDQFAFMVHDLFLLENQLPFQLLEILIDSCNIEVPYEERGKNPQEILKDCIDQFIVDFCLMSPAKQIPTPIHDQVDSQTPLCHEQRQQQEEPVHLLALLRSKLIGQGIKSQEKLKGKDGLLKKLMRKWCPSGAKSRQWPPRFRNAKELKAKGIRFKAKETIDGITDIDYNDHFCRPTLTLAPIVVDDHTMPKLLNLIAYEMCPDFKNKFEITSYVSFLESLIDSREDVKELRDAGVVHNALGSDKAVAELFNRISDNLVPNPEIHRDLNLRIQEHCDRVWASDVAQICHTYFSSPWSFIVFLGAVAVLVMTGVQTYNSF